MLNWILLNSATMSKVKVIVGLVLMSGLWLVKSDHCTQQSPASDGSTFTIKQILNRANVKGGRLLLNLKDRSGSTKNVLECPIKDEEDTTIIPCVVADISESAYYSGSIVRLEDQELLEATVTIGVVNRARDEGTWAWVWQDGDTNNNVLGQCDLVVYSFPNSPVCYNMKIDTSVKWSCTLNNVYPDITVSLKYLKLTDDDRSNIVSDVTQFVKTKKTAREDYGGPETGIPFDYQFVLDLPFDKLNGTGNYEFNIEVTMDLSPLGFNKSLTKTATPASQKFELPSVELMNCPNSEGSTQGYISPRETKTCGCHLKTPGVPAGFPTWSESGHNLSNVQENDNRNLLTLELKYDPDDGPSEISLMSIQVQESNQSDCCVLIQNVSVTVNCSISSATAFSEPRINIRLKLDDDNNNNNNMPSSTITLENTGTSSGFYWSVFKVVPKEGGVYNVTCVAVNPLFDDVTAQKTESVELWAPPSLDPQVEINGGQPIANGAVVKVALGQSVKVNCRVRGGYPEATFVTLTCNEKERTTEGPRGSYSLEVTRITNNTECSCRSQHVTGCYNKTTTISFLVQGLNYVDIHHAASGGDGDLGDAEIAGIVTGVLLSLVILVAGVFLILRKWRNQDCYYSDTIRSNCPSNSSEQNQIPESNEGVGHNDTTHQQDEVYHEPTDLRDDRRPHYEGNEYPYVTEGGRVVEQEQANSYTEYLGYPQGAGRGQGQSPPSRAIDEARIGTWNGTDTGGDQTELKVMC